ncbi:MAG: IS200/IS605 family transposase [Spirochaetes bacterium]|nr:IS200/IS605 family transposase [Spirochaetota bacterium]
MFPTYTKTYNKLLYHIVFATRYRMPVITREMLGILRILFKEKADELGCVLYIANGYRDHVHVLVSASPKLSVSRIVMHLKGYSSYMTKELSWQQGYSVFSVDEGSFRRVFDYIKNQERRHNKI